MKKKNLKNLNLSKESISILRKNEVIGGTLGTWTRNDDDKFPGGGSSHEIVVCYTGCGTNCQ